MTTYSKIILSIVTVLTVVLWLATPDANAKVYKVGPGTSKLQSIQIYQGNSLKDPFEVIGRITVRTTLKSQLYKEMKSKAKKFQAQAVLNYTEVNAEAATSGAYTGNQNQATGVIIDGKPSAQGIAVRFKKDGITKITDETVVPVLN